jgi:hypothetical protein
MLKTFGRLGLGLAHVGALLQRLPSALNAIKVCLKQHVKKSSWALLFRAVQDNHAVFTGSLICVVDWEGAERNKLELLI